MSKETHIERTATEPRDVALHAVTIASIDQINPSIRIFRLAIPSPAGIRFSPGQWVDLYLPYQPSLAPGGFTLTSSPSSALPFFSSSSQPYIELAIQLSPTNPIASHLWQPPSLLLNIPLSVRIGGSFIFPPPLPPNSPLKKVIFLAGGVGINPLISMLTHLFQTPTYQNLNIQFLYSLKDPGPSRRDAKSILFLERILGIFRSKRVKGELRLFLTGGEDGEGKRIVSCEGGDVPFEGRRIEMRDVEEALGEWGEREEAVVYVCGPPGMTDAFVGGLVGEGGLGVDRGRIFFEKWW